MSMLNLITLVATTAIFVVWAVLMFRMLGRMTRRSLDRLDQTGGGYVTWVGHSIGSFFAFFASDEDRTERRRLLLVTGLLVACVIARFVSLT